MAIGYNQKVAMLPRVRLMIVFSGLVTFHLLFHAIFFLHLCQISPVLVCQRAYCLVLDCDLGWMVTIIVK